MIIARHDYEVDGKPAAFVFRYLRGAKCWLLENQHSYKTIWSEAFDSSYEGRKAFNEMVKLLSVKF